VAAPALELATEALEDVERGVADEQAADRQPQAPGAQVGGREGHALCQYMRIDNCSGPCEAVAMAGRSTQLQIRVTREQKETLRRLAHLAGQDMSSYVLSRALPDAKLRFAGLLGALRAEEEPGFVLAELNDLLSGLASAELQEAVEHAELAGLSSYLRNYVAAMVELAVHRRGVSPPSWVHDIEPLDAPRFPTSLAGLRLHLLRSAPVPFKRRNIFVDSSLGDRV